MIAMVRSDHNRVHGPSSPVGRSGRRRGSPLASAFVGAALNTLMDGASRLWSREVVNTWSMTRPNQAGHDGTRATTLQAQGCKHAVHSLALVFLTMEEVSFTSSDSDARMSVMDRSGGEVVSTDVALGGEQTVVPNVRRLSRDWRHVSILRGHLAQSGRCRRVLMNE